jgi:BTB/POZ domain-containing protein 9
MRRWNPSELLNGQFLKFTGSSGFTSHQIGVNKIVVQLGTVCIHLQISFKKLYLFNTINTLDKTNWKIAVDRRNVECKSWQFLQFDQRSIVFIRITGTHNTANDVSF